MKFLYFLQKMGASESLERFSFTGTAVWKKKKKNRTIQEERGRGQLSSTLASSRNGKRLEAKPYK